MIDPGTMLAVGGKVLVGKHVVESVVAGNDPSLVAMTALAFSPVNPSIPMAPQAGEHVLALKDLGELTSADPNVRERVFMEQYVDSKYMNHGNLEDAWAQLKNGELTFDTFVLAMVDIVDALTFGVFKPQLLEVKINPHLKAREIVYRAEISYDTPEKSVEETVIDGAKKQETTNTQRRITQVSRITFEISPEAFQKADLSFAESVARIKSADLADRTIIFARLDTLTEKDLKILSENGLREIEVQSQRLQSVETQENLLSSGKRDMSELIANGGTLVDDRESRFSTIKTSEQASAPNLSEEQMSKAGIRVYGSPQLSADQKTTTVAQQQETIDHLNGARDIKSTVTEQIDRKQVAEESSGRMKWTREGTRVREAVGQYDIFSLKDVSVDEFVASGAKLLSDKARVQDTVVAVDISRSGETVNFIDSEKTRSWLVRESDIRREQASSVETQTLRVAKQVTDYDYLANSREIRSATIQDKVTTATTVKDIVETKTHWNFFGWNAAGFLGENIKTEVTPTVTTHTSIGNFELAPGQDIFTNFNATQDTLVARGSRIANRSSDVATEKQETVTQLSFTEGTISHVPFVGGIGHLASKAGLGGEVTLQDAFWAAADVAEILVTTVAIVAAPASGGTSVATLVAARSAKAAAKAATKAVMKEAAKTGGKAVIKGTIRIAGKSSARLAAKASATNLAKSTVKQTGKITLKNGGRAGAKASLRTSKVSARTISRVRNSYLDDVVNRSSFKDTIDVSKLKKRPWKRISPEKNQIMREQFSNAEFKEKLIKDWEKIHHREWPTYPEDVYLPGKTNPYRLAGQRYDAHHIQPLGMNGKNVAGNLTPVHALEHADKMGIHSLGSPYDKLNTTLGAM